MARRFSWCTVVALVVLLFVTTEGLRERNTQIDDNKPTSRGTLRFTSKSLEEGTTVPSLLQSRSKATRGRLTPSKRSSYVDKHTEDTTLSPAINSELNFDPSKSSIAKTTRTNERARLPATTEATNDLKRNPLSRNAGVTKRPESGVNRRNGKRYSPDSDEAAILKNNEQKTSVDGTKGLSRKASSGRTSESSATERLDNRGPSVFLATTESSRSRTGRKIQTTYSMKDLKTQIPTSRRYVNKKFGDAEATTVSVRRDGRGRSTTEKTERSTRSGRSKASNKENVSTTRRGPDTILSESESVRVDIPLVVDGTESPIPEVTTIGFGTVSQRRSDVKDTTRSSGRNGSERSKGRGRSNDSEAGSRRGSSRFNDFTTTEPTEQIVRNAVPRDRSRGSDGKKSSASDSRSRSRGRNFENSVKANSAGAFERDAKRKLVGERGSSDRRSRVLDATLRPIDSRGQDTQDTRVRARNRPRSDVATFATTDVTTTITPDTTILSDITTINPDLTGTTLRPVTTVPTTTSPRTTTRPSTTTSTTEAPGRGRGRARGGSQGRKSKEDFFNHGLGFRGRKLSPDGSSNATESRRTTLSRNDPQSHGNPGWTLRRRPGHLNYPEGASRTVVPSPTDQTNEVIPSNEQSTSTEVVTTVETVTSSTRRGSKKQQTAEESTTVAGATTKGYRRGNKTFGPSTTTADHEDSDNYPPEFKAKLNQLKNTDTKIPASKTTPRSPLEVKRSSAALFAERSRMKLDLARRLVKPELNIEENDLDATTASSFSKTKPAGVTVAEETTSKAVGKYSKPTATTAARRTLTSIESSREEASVKASKRSSSRKALEDSSPKVTARPYSIKKGRIIAERMVTSISIEERVTPEETTKPYAMADSSVVTASTEEASATTIDSIKIRPAGTHKGKKSKEQDSKLPLSSKRRVENADSVTARPQKKSYSYQPRINKSQDQPTTIEQAPTAISSKKSHAFTQRKSVTSQEEAGTKKSIFGSGATKPSFRPRYSKRNKQKLVEEKTQQQPTVTTQQPIATSRYSRKKSVVKSTEDKSQPGATEENTNQARKLEFRPRTATYRRHSEVPTTLVQSTARADGTGVAITPRSTKYHATLKTSTPTARSVEQEPQVNIRIANETTQETTGIIGSSNGGNGNSNIFSPTRSTAILSGNNTLLEQVRSTVAPLLSSLGNRTPVFSGSYSNVNNANSPPRITPSGQPPRFSARYKGAELFIRKQNNIYQPTVPSITSSSTTAVTPVESNALLNTQMGTASIVSTGRPATDSQGGRIVQDRERDEATRTREAGGQRSSVYIGQDKFVNYWTDGATTTNPRALSVKINSVATGTNLGPSVSVPSFDNLLNNQPGGRVTAPPGFPWRDPLDQIFGITTSSPIITASVASNTLDDSTDLNGPAMARPINPFVEVFTPFSSAIGVPRGSIGTIPPPPPPTSTQSTTTTSTMMMPSTTTTMAPTTTTTTTMAPTTTTTTTTMAPTTTTTTTTMAPTTTTTTMMAPTTTTTTMAPTTTTTTTMAPTTRATMPAPTTTSAPTTGQRANLASQTAGIVSTTSAPLVQTTQFTLPPNLLNAQQQQNAFGTTFDDLAFLNSLLQSNSRSTTQKTLTQVEQLLANKILSLALNSPGSTRAPKAINIDNVTPNSIYGSSKSPSEPIVIDLSPSSTVSAPTWKPTEAQKSTTVRSISSSTPQQVTQKPAISSTTTKKIEISTRGPIKVTPKPVTTPRPRTTTQQPLGFAGLLWQTLLGGGNLFGPSTTAKPVKSKPVKTSPKLVDITPKPIQTTLKTTQRPKTTTVTPSTTTVRAVDVSKVRVNTNAIVEAEKSATTPFSVSTTKQPLLNNPNPRVPSVVTSTYSPEEDAKFLVELLRAVDQDNKSGGSKKAPGLSQDDESFLRAILSGQAAAKTTPSPTSEINNAALLAALLKAQGIEPPTPSTNIREQLQMASLGQSVTSAPAGGSTTITTRPTSTATRATDSAKRTVTPRPTSGSRIRTTTWSPSSTYPPPLFSSFPGVPEQASGDDSRQGALFGATRAFSQFLGAALSGAAQQLQSLVRNGTRIVSEVVG